jgi:hypothetical protein
VKITLHDPATGREFLVQQVIEAHGHNPWTGEPLTREYTAVLADGLAEIEIAGSALEEVLDRITGMAPELRIDPASILEPLRERLDRLNAAKEGSTP